MFILSDPLLGTFFIFLILFDIFGFIVYEIEIDKLKLLKYKQLKKEIRKKEEELNSLTNLGTVFLEDRNRKDF